MVIGGYTWNELKTDEKGTYYILNGTLGNFRFGDNNNYETSDVRKDINKSDLLKQLKEEFGDRLVPITTDLFSHDGSGTYGMLEGDLLALPTFDLHRENRKNFPLIDEWYWLSTPESTADGYGDHCVQCALSDGYVGYGECVCFLGVRPFFILKS